MGSLKQLVNFAFLWSLSVVWTSYAIYLMLREFFKCAFKSGPMAFFRVKPRPSPPKALTEEWDYATIETADGLKVHHVRAGSRNKPLMLMLHGFPEFWYSWRHQIRHFQKDYRVIAIDMRGYGDSDKPTGIDNYTMDKLKNDIKQIISALGYTSCVLVAHDWGGAVAWLFALDNAEMVDKFIVCNCPHPRAFQQFFRGGSLTQMRKSWYMFFFQVPFLPELFMMANDMKILETFFTDVSEGGARNPKAFTQEDLEAWKYTFQRTPKGEFSFTGGMSPPINYYRAAFRRPQRAKRSGAEWVVQPPTLVIWGTEDFALETEMADLSLKFCRDGTLRKVEGASHWVQQDQPHRVNELMEHFLQG